jgi:micrococcal nuclease
MNPLPFVYSARLIAVHDADTITVDIDLGFSIVMRNVKLRLNGINAPELSTPEGKIAQAWLASRIAGKPLVIKTIKDRQEKYGRLLAEVYVLDEHINASLAAAGHALPWDGKGTKPV